MKKIHYSFIAVIVLLFCFSAPAAAITISSPYAIVVDAKDGGPLYEKNADVLRPAASTTKIMSLYLVFEAIDNGTITMETPITISREMHEYSVYDDWTNVPLNEGQAYTVRKLIEATCVESGCASIMAIGEYMDGSLEEFVNHMNRKGQEMGLNATFADATGVSRNSMMSARALGTLTYETIKNYPQFLTFTAMTRTTIDGVVYTNTNQLLPGGNYYYPGADGVKTGVTTPAGKCMVATAKQGDTRVITVVLAASTFSRRYNDTVNLLNYGFTTAPLYPLIFKDVANNAWYFPYVETIFNQGFMNGTSTYTFEPETSVDRAMFVTVLGRIWEKQNTTIQETSAAFPDTEAGSWYQRYVDWAAANGIVQGFEDGTFRPYTTITREEMMNILYNYNTFINGEVSVSSLSLTGFEDSSTIQQWAVEGAAWCVANGIINGTDNSHLDPQGTADRAQMSKVFVEYNN